MQNLNSMTDIEIKKSFPEIINNVNKQINSIKSCQNIDEANQYFDTLQTLNDTITEIIFLKKIKVPDQLFKFFKDFDRIDDIRVREYMFKDIKSGEYTPFCLLNLN